MLTQDVAYDLPNVIFSSLNQKVAAYEIQFFEDSIQAIVKI
jgi:hypothetical protein